MKKTFKVRHLWVYKKNGLGALCGTKHPEYFAGLMILVDCDNCHRVWDSKMTHGTRQR
jgi:hypothetical protein